MTVFLFDMFGVIVRPQPASSRAVLEAAAGVEGGRFWDAYWRCRPAYDGGEVTAAGYWRRVAASAGTSFAGLQIAELTAADLASWSEVDPECVDLICSLAERGVRLGLLSNIPEELARHYEQTGSWLRHFSVVGFSCRLGRAKPDPETYRWCCRRLGAAPAGVRFVDDRKENVAAARQVGLRGHVFTSVGALEAVVEEDLAAPSAARHEPWPHAGAIGRPCAESPAATAPRPGPRFVADPLRPPTSAGPCAVCPAVSARRRPPRGTHR